MNHTPKLIRIAEIANTEFSDGALIHLGGKQTWTSETEKQSHIFLLADLNVHAQEGDVAAELLVLRDFLMVNGFAGFQIADPAERKNRIQHINEIMEAYCDGVEEWRNYSIGHDPVVSAKRNFMKGLDIDDKKAELPTDYIKGVEIAVLTTKGLCHIMAENEIAFEIKDEQITSLLNGKSEVIPVYKRGQQIQGVIVSLADLQENHLKYSTKRFPEIAVRNKIIKHIYDWMRRGNFIEIRDYPAAETVKIPFNKK